MENQHNSLKKLFNLLIQTFYLYNSYYLSKQNTRNKNFNRKGVIS